MSGYIHIRVLRHTLIHRHTHTSRPMKDQETKPGQLFRRQTQGHCCFNSVRSGFLICTKVICVKASYNKASLGVFKLFRQIVLSRALLFILKLRLNKHYTEPPPLLIII